MKLELTGLPTLLLILFVTLKLCDVIAWSWWWVLSPIWLPLCIAGVAVLIWALITVIVAVVKND